MNKIILALAAFAFLTASHCHASQQDTYNVDDRGSVSKGCYGN